MKLGTGLRSPFLHIFWGMVMVVSISLVPVESQSVVRPAAVAGTWYPGQAQALSRELDQMLQKAKGTPGPVEVGTLRAIVVPHAGYRFSGDTAAAAMKPLTGMTFKRVVVLGPSHKAHFQGLSLPSVQGFQTPLGDIPLDLLAMDRLRKHPMIRSVTGSHETEHSIEMTLPLLQKVLAKGWKLLPILVGDLDLKGFAQVAASLKPLLDDHTLLVISGDFTHYGAQFGFRPFPVDQEIQTNLEKLDMGMVEKILHRDVPGLMDYKLKTGITACVFGPVALLLHLLDDAVTPHLIQYRTSGADGGDFSHSVSYVALAFYSRHPLNHGATDPGEVSKEGLTTLHAMACEAIMAALAKDQGGVSTETIAGKYSMPQRFHEPSGAFVTLKKRGNLRGCIGYILPVEPLYQAVIHNAVNAALKDPRFKPVSADELTGMEIEINILSPMRPAASWQEFQVGEHGVVMAKNGHRAVFLPEVAVEQGWSREETLTHLAQKAGLPGDAWRQGATFELFTSQSFSAPFGVKGGIDAL